MFPELTVSDLSVAYRGHDHAVNAVDDVSFRLSSRRILGLVGESGSGKTTVSRALLGLLPPSAEVVHGSVNWKGQDLLTLGATELRRIRGKEISMVFQNPGRSLHHAFTIGWQLREAMEVHGKVSRREADSRAIELLEWVGIPEARNRLHSYPHQFSGGMQQRVSLAMALMNSPELLIADEPTTALDVTVQAQLLRLLRRLSRNSGMSVLFITHNLAAVASLCDDVLVMKSGRVVETGPVDQVFTAPRERYTAELLNSMPDRLLRSTRGELATD